MIRNLIPSLREYKWPALISPLCMIGEVYMEVQIPLVLAQIVDLGVEMGDMGAVVKYGMLLVLYALLSLLFGIASAVSASYAATGFSKNLRQDMFYKVQTFDFSNIDKFSSSSIVTRLTSDIANIQMAFQMMIRMAIRCPVMLVLATYNAYSISPRLCLVYCVVLPLLGLGLFILIRLVFPIFDRVFKTYDKLNNVVQENLHGIRVVKSFVREDKEIEKFSDVSGEIYRDFCKAAGSLLLRADHLLPGCENGHSVRQLCRAGSDHRQPDLHVHLHHPDPHRTDDAVHGFRHDDPVPCTSAPYL